MADKASQVIASTAVNYRIKRSVLNNSRAKKVTWLKFKSFTK